MCIWQKLTTETIEKTCGKTGKGYFVKVPISQVFLDDLSNKILLTYTNLPEHITNYNLLFDMPNPTNDFVAPYYGVKSLWNTTFSQGIVVKAEDDSDYIAMECSSKNKGFKRTKVILTMGGCM